MLCIRRQGKNIAEINQEYTGTYIHVDFEKTKVWLVLQEVAFSFISAMLSHSRNYENITYRTLFFSFF